jgi:hypothetical protein
VRVCVSEERLIEDEVLGLGERGASSTVASEAEANEPIIAEGLRRHVDGEDESVDASEVASRAVCCENKEVKLEARLCVEFLEGRGKMEERVGLCSVAVLAVEVDNLRFWVILRAKERNGDGVLKLSAPWRLLRGVCGGEVERSITCWGCCDVIG